MIEDLVIKDGEDIPEETIKLMTEKDQRGYVHISDGSWEQNNLPEFCAKIDEWKTCAKFSFGNNQYPLIVHDLFHIKFPNLKQINLWANQISSFELISLIYWPNLLNFSINSNHLFEFRSFRKSNMKKLKTLALSSNAIHELTCLSEFDSEYLDRFVLEFGWDRPMCNNIDWLGKMSAKPRDLYIMSQDRIDLLGVQAAIKRLNENFLVRK